jgi:hypothetical protein
MRVLIVEDEWRCAGRDESSGRRGSDVMATAEQRHHAPAFLKESEEYLAAGRISSAYRKPDTCWQHHASLTGGVSYSEPASVTLYLLSLLPLAVISIDWLSLRFAGPRAAWA